MAKNGSTAWECEFSSLRWRGQFLRPLFWEPISTPNLFPLFPPGWSHVEPESQNGMRRPAFSNITCVPER